MIRFLAGVIFTLAVVAAVLFVFRDAVGTAVGVQRITPLATVIEKATPTEKTVYAEAHPFVQLTGSEPQFFGLLQSDRLLVAGGDCTAGIDFQKNPPRFATDQKGTVTMMVLEPELFGCGITEQRFFDGRGLVPASQNLSNTLSNEVATMLADAAVRSGILRVAQDSAATKLELRLRQMSDALGAKLTSASVQFAKR